MENGKQEIFFKKDIVIGKEMTVPYVYTRNRIYHRSPMQTERSQPEDKRIMPETSFRHYPLTRGLGFLRLHRRPMFDYFSYLWH